MNAQPLRLVALLGLVALAGCPGKDLPQQSNGVETFANPPELTPDGDGVYQLRYGPHEVTIDGARYCLRTYNGAVPGRRSVCARGRTVGCG